MKGAKTNSNPMSKKSSAYWKHFIEVEEEGYVNCDICNTRVFRGVGKNVTTANMKRHLQSNHPLQFQIVEREMKGKTEDQESRHQITLQETLTQGKPWSIDDSRSQTIHYAIGEMIALDYEPYSIVERSGFKRMMKLLKPNYQLPSRTYMADKILPDIFTRVKTKLHLKLDKAKWISGTSDAWTATNAQYSFLSLTASWIDNNYEKQEVIVAIKHLTSRHTGTNLANTLNEVMQEWGIQNKLHLIVRDNGTNMIKALEEANIVGLPCFLHTLQLVIHDAINSQRAVKDMIARSRSLAGHFRMSPTATSQLSEIQKRLNLSEKRFIQDVSTRWNSTYDMLSRMLEMKTEIGVYCNEYNLNNLNFNDWNLLPSILAVLQPFKELTLTCGASDSLISDVIPSVMILQKYLSKENPAHCWVGTMKDELLKSLNRRFKDIEANENYTVATIIDPRYKDSFFSETFALDELKSKLVNLIYEDQDKKASSIAGKVAKGESTNLPKVSDTFVFGPQNIQQNAHSSFWNEFEEIASKRARVQTETVFTEEEQRKKSLLVEIDTFLQIKLLEPYKEATTSMTGREKNNPLKWWAKNSAIFPGLAAIVPRFLSAPPSSIDSERVFSEAGLVYEDKRSRLKPEKAESLVFLHHNLPKLDYCY